MHLKIKPKGLFKKLLYYQFFLIFLIILLLFFTLSYVEKRFWSSYLLKEAKTHLKLLNPQIMRIFGREFGKSTANLEIAKGEIANILKEKEGVIDIAILDNDGRILFSFNNSNLPPYKPEEYKINEGLLYREVFLGGKKYLDLVLPQQTMGFSNFYFRYLMFFPAIERQIRNVNIILLVLGVFSAGLGLTFSYYFTRKITIPLQLLGEKAKAIRKGDWEQEIPMLEDEIGELAEALRTMIIEIKNKQNELLLQNDRLKAAFDDLLFLQNQMLNYEKFAALGKISAGMSHEIDNPLGIIIGHAEYLKSELPKDSVYLEDLETIIREATRIKKIMRSLLSFAKPKESKIKEIELKSFIKSVLDDFSFQKIFRNITLNFEAEEIEVYADEEKLHQSIVNIVLNAIQAMPKGGEITVNIYKHSGFGCIAITDTGIGIPEELKERVFDLFFSTKKDGTGLGLAVTKSFIEDMRGKIELISSEGKGTTINVYLPLSESIQN